MADYYTEDHEGAPVFIYTEAVIAVYTKQDGSTVVLVGSDGAEIVVNEPIRDVLTSIRPGWDD